MADIYRFEVGKLQCIAINDGVTEGPTTRFFPDAETSTDLQAALDAYGVDRQKTPNWFNLLVINTGTHQVLVDTGNGQTDSEDRGNLLANMEKAGLSPDDIDTVIITHAHGDHYLGNTLADGKPTFLNARYKMWRGEWEHWLSDEAMAEVEGQAAELRQRHFLSIKDRFDLIDTEGEIVPGIEAVHAPGHSPGHMALLIGGEVLHIVDAVHQVFQVEYPQFGPRFDADPDRAVETRKALFKRAMDGNLTVFAYHLPFPALAYIVPKGESQVWQPIEDMG